MLIDKAEIERVKRGNELVAFIRSRGVTLTQRGKQLSGYAYSMMTMNRRVWWSLIVNNCGTVWVRVTKAATCIAML